MKQTLAIDIDNLKEFIIKELFIIIFKEFMEVLLTHIHILNTFRPLKQQNEGLRSRLWHHNIKKQSFISMFIKYTHKYTLH